MDEIEKKSFISIIIVNWNGRKWLKKCLDSLMLQTYKDFEIILVDNASSDDSVAFVEKNYPKVVIVKSEKNLGFAGGNNLGYRYAKGEYILLLNNDTWAEKNYLKNFLQSFKEIPNLGSVQSKIILMNKPDKLDVCGSYWTNSTFLYHYGYGQSQNKEIFNKKGPFFSNKGASIMLKKSIIEKIGLFDEDFWCYYEETDLCHRLWIAGYECWYYPNAVMYHAMGGTSTTINNSYIQYHNFKNKLLSFLKNFEITSLIYILPIFLFFNIALSFFWLIQGKWRHFFSIYKSIFWNILNFKKTLQKRKKIQNFRKKTDQEIMKKTKKNPKLKYYYYLLVGLEKYEE